MRYLPIALDLAGRDVLVVGAGGDATPTVLQLLDAGARVTVIASARAGGTRERGVPTPVDDTLERAAASARIALHRRPFHDSDLDGKALVVVTPDDDALARRLHDALAPAGRLLCVLDRPEHSTCVKLGIVSVPARDEGQRGIGSAGAPSLTMAFGSDGVSPGTVRRIREDLTALFSEPRFALYLEALRRLRDSLPRGPERVARMREAVEGFAIEARLRLPAWVPRVSLARDGGA